MRGHWHGRRWKSRQRHRRRRHKIKDKNSNKIIGAVCGNGSDNTKIGADGGTGRDTGSNTGIGAAGGTGSDTSIVADCGTCSKTVRGSNGGNTGTNSETCIGANNETDRDTVSNEGIGAIGGRSSGTDSGSSNGTGSDLDFESAERSHSSSVKRNRSSTRPILDLSGTESSIFDLCDSDRAKAENTCYDINCISKAIVYLKSRKDSSSIWFAAGIALIGFRKIVKTNLQTKIAAHQLDAESDVDSSGESSAIGNIAAVMQSNGDRGEQEQHCSNCSNKTKWRAKFTRQQEIIASINFSMVTTDWEVARHNSSVAISTLIRKLTIWHNLNNN